LSIEEEEQIAMSELSITSIVATGKIDREFELGALGNDIDTYSCDYSPDEHPGLYVKFCEDGPTITIFTSGSFNIRGASSKKELHKNKSLLENSLSSLGIQEAISEFQITNIVFTSDLEEEIDLNEFAIILGLESVEYEPEQFPGLVYRLDQGVILIFSSGKLILTGFTNIEDAKQALNTLSVDLTDD
jgi:transcription initiation factor TFIID TATA-box-binding protein